MFKPRESQQLDIIMANGLPMPTRKTRKQFVIATLVLCWITIGLISWQGSPENSLHTSALSWAFAVSTATLFAYVFGAILDNYNFLNAIQKENERVYNRTLDEDKTNS